MTDYLFLYGTLLSGMAPPPLAGLVDQLQRVGAGTVRGRLYDLGRYPGAILDAAAETRIAGEVFRLPDDPSNLADFDRYEGYNPADPEGSLYHRRRTEVTLQNGTSLECWVYVYNRDVRGVKLIECGDYLEWRRGGVRE